MASPIAIHDLAQVYSLIRDMEKVYGEEVMVKLCKHYIDDKEKAKNQGWATPGLKSLMDGSGAVVRFFKDCSGALFGPSEEAPAQAKETSGEIPAASLQQKVWVRPPRRPVKVEGQESPV
jgi:hypothetical protein